MVLGNTGRGGAQAYVMNVLRSIDKRRFKIDIAVNESKPDGYDDEIRLCGSDIYYFPKFKIFNWYQFQKRWEELLKTQKYDIIEAHATNSASVYFNMAKKLGIRTIAHSHSAGYRGKKVEKMIKKLFSRLTKAKSDYWFACSDLAAKRLFGDDYKFFPRYYEIPNAIDTIEFKFDKEKRDYIRNKLGISNNTMLIGHVGTFSEPKNHSFLIDVFYEMQNYKTEFKLLLLGDGQLRNVIIEKVKKMGLTDRVIFAGNVQNVNEYMMAMDAFVFPSIFEGFPVVLIEAQTTGLPCFISDSITDEVSQTDLITRISLDLQPQEWSNTIKSSIPTERTKYFPIIHNSKYEIKNNVEFLMQLYQKILDDQNK